MCQFEHSELKCTAIVIWLFTFGNTKNTKIRSTVEAAYYDHFGTRTF
jgi:hypothetical protein